MGQFASMIQVVLGAFCVCATASVGFAQELRTVPLDGYSLHVYTDGWEHIERGQPVVVFEGGSTVPIEAWERVLAEVAQSAAVVAFDPPGTGRSEWNGERPTLEYLNVRLHRLLEALEAPPPYVLVGHSWAGWVVRGYAGRYPDEVAGLVLVDPTPPHAEFMGAFEEIGVDEAGMDEWNRIMQSMSATWPPPMRAQQDVIHEYSETGADPEVPAAASVPVAVVAAGRYGDTTLPTGLSPPFDWDRYWDVLRRRQIVAPIEWVRSSPDGTFVLANGSQHCVQCDDPGLVAWAIRRVLSATQR